MSESETFAASTLTETQDDARQDSDRRKRPPWKNKGRADNDGDWRREGDQDKDNGQSWRGNGQNREDLGEQQKDNGQSWRGHRQNWDDQHWNDRSCWNDRNGWRDSGWQEHQHQSASSTSGKSKGRGRAGGKNRSEWSSTNDTIAEDSVVQSRNDDFHEERSRGRGKGRKGDRSQNVDGDLDSSQTEYDRGFREPSEGKGKGGERHRRGGAKQHLQDNDDGDNAISHQEETRIEASGSRDKREGKGKGKGGDRRRIGPQIRSARDDAEDDDANVVQGNEDRKSSQAKGSRKGGKGKDGGRRRIGPGMDNNYGADDIQDPEEDESQANRKADSEKRGKGRGKQRQNYHASGKGGLGNEADLTQTESLSEELGRGTYECMICINKVRRFDPIWSCGNCFAALHIKCIHQWIRKSSGDSKGPEFAWSCPGCRYHFVDTLPKYTCFCGKMHEPEANPHILAHSCGEVCGRKRNCSHPCNELCHAGPCPPCTAVGPPGECHCGREVKAVTRCGDPSRWSCQSICGRELACGKHTCQLRCHAGPCPPCKTTSKQECFCGAKQADRSCGEESWACGGVCGNLLDCGKHYCEQLCHDGPCAPCQRNPESWGDRCACGRTRNCKSEAAAALLVKWVGARKQCTDPLPLCGARCDKALPCGHLCSRTCHEGPCGKCDKKVSRLCRCGQTKVEVPCGDEGEVLCAQVCRTKKHCGNHRCDVVCCPGYNDRNHEDHFCLQVCGKPLACGVHVCEDFCHLGKCKPCRVVHHEPLCCACGAESIQPPVRCGTAPPACREICAAELSCGHHCTSTCHFGQHPRCCELVDRQCFGGHRVMKFQPCHIGAISCGEKCGKRLDCEHACATPCHSGDCPPCTQPCGARRPHCDHPCELPCHPGEACADVPCRAKIKMSCPCGLRVETQTCGAFSGKSRPAVPILKCGNSCGERSRIPSIDGLKTSPQEEKYAADIHSLATKNSKYIVVLEHMFIHALSSNTRVALPPCDSSRRTLAMEYARLNWRFKTTTKRDAVEGWYVVTIEATRLGRVPWPRLSEIMTEGNSKHISTRLGSQPCLRFTGCKGVGDEMYDLVGLEDLLGVRPGQESGEILAFMGRSSTAMAAFRTLTSQEPNDGQLAPVTHRNFGSSGLHVSLENILASLGGRGAQSVATKGPSARGSAWGKSTAQNATTSPAPKQTPKPSVPAEPEPIADSWEDM